jgi:hypothetical protein
MCHSLQMFLVLMLSLAVPACTNNSPTCAVTCMLNGGRLGDDVFSMSQAFWIHHHYGVPLLFPPFKHSQELNISRHYPHHTTERFVMRCVNVDKNTAIDKSNNTLYITHYNPNNEIPVDWSDVSFVDAFRAEIYPADENWPFMCLPTDQHTIAIHMRRGGTFWGDKYIWRITRPMQFPHFDYYVQALNILLQHLDGPCYIHIFTDDPKPKSLARKIKERLSTADQARVTIKYR